jgi:sulfite reductase (ferredoxin)
MGILFNQIENDLKKSFDAGKAHEKTSSPESLYDQLFYATRSLLVVKGLEARSQPEVFDLFRDNFIGAGIAPESYSDLMAIGKRSVDSRRLLEGHEEAIRGFCDHVFQLYEEMDDCLHFPGEDREDGAMGMPEASEGNGGHARVDYRGMACPMNYVKAKLVLETMSEGDILEILLDDGEPIENVPRSLSWDGQEIVSQTREDRHWRVTVVKRA